MALHWQMVLVWNSTSAGCEVARDAAEQDHPDANFELSKIYANKALTDIFNPHLSDKFLVKAPI